MTVLDRFVAAFGVWEEALPYLPMMVDESEMRLLVAMRGQAVTIDEAAKLLGIERAGEFDQARLHQERILLGLERHAGIRRLDRTRLSWAF